MSTHGCHLRQFSMSGGQDSGKNTAPACGSSPLSDRPLRCKLRAYWTVQDVGCLLNAAKSAAALKLGAIGTLGDYAAIPRRRLTDRLQGLQPRDARIQEGIIERLEMKVRSAHADLERAQSVYDTESTNAARRRDRNAPERSRRQLVRAQRQLDVAQAHLADEQELRPASSATAALMNRVQLEVDVIDKILSLRRPAQRSGALQEHPDPLREESVHLHR